MPPYTVLNFAKGCRKKCIFISHHKDMVQNIRKTTSKLFENVTCLGITVADQAYIHDEVTRSVRFCNWLLLVQICITVTNLDVITCLG
jgi:hypothetical protein